MSLPLFQGVLDSGLSDVHAGSLSMVGLLIRETNKHAPDPERPLMACPVSASDLRTIGYACLGPKAVKGT